MTRGAAGLLVLAVAAPALLALAVVTARPPAAPVPDRDGYFARWSVLHGGYDLHAGSVWARGWMTMVHALARPLARRGVQPDVVTLASVWVAGLLVVLADVGGRWALLGAATVVVSGLLDNLDGCVAVLEDRTSRWGYVLDSVVDRVSDMAYLLAAVAVGCPPGLAAATGLAVFLLEYARARSGNAGGDDVGRITAAERPTRVILLTPPLLAAGAVPGLAGETATGCTAVLLAMTLLGLGQLLAVVRRQLLALPPAS